MKPRRLTFLAILFAAVCIPAIAWIFLTNQKAPEHPFRLSDRLSWVDIEGDAGSRSIRYEDSEGESQVYSAEEFIEAILSAQGTSEARPSLTARRLFNITSWQTGVFWVSIGLLGQVLFTGRMIVQWISSEKEKRSVIPVSFWWMSLSGATMLIIYFVWRVDIVGILGQSTGWFVYLRNLWLIYGEEERQEEA